MATGTSNPAAGWHQLEDSLADPAQVYVPPQCEGPHRCPLVMHLGEPAFVPPVADRYGMIGLVPSAKGDLDGSVSSHNPFLLEQLDEGSEETVWKTDSLLRRVLRDFAIDPARIAMVGNSIYGNESGVLGRTNPDVFSRIAPMSPSVGGAAMGVGPRDTTAQVFAAGGLAEPGFLVTAMTIAQQRWLEGQPVKPVLFFMGHAHTRWNYNWAWRWFHESWTTSSTRPVDPQALAAALPVLTPALVDTMLAFWRQWEQKPQSILEAATDQDRWKEVPVLAGRRVYTLIMPDMVALAAEFPWVATTLRAFGFSAQRWERYRAALASAGATIVAVDNWVAIEDPRLVEPPVDPTSVLGKNVAVFRANSERLTKSLMANP